jgi:hypothetical protein
MSRSSANPTEWNRLSLRIAFEAWRDPGVYAPLVDLDRGGLAWEWLRRVPAYREAPFAAGQDSIARAPAVPVAQEVAERWGLIFRRACRPSCAGCPYNLVGRSRRLGPPGDRRARRGHP